MCTCLLRNCYVTVYVPDYVTAIRVLGSGTNEGSSPRSGRGRPPSLVPTVKDAPNHVPMNMIGLAHISRKILEDGDVPTSPLVLITPYYQQLTVIVPVSHYPPSARRLL